MFQVRLYGRSGQGVVSGAEILASAGHFQGKLAHAFPAFVSDRVGAPLVAFCRWDEQKIVDRSPIEKPDCVILLDPTLLHTINVFQGLSPKGYAFINSAKSWDVLGIADEVAHLPCGHVIGLNASAIGRQHIGRPVPNSALLGAFAATTKEIQLDALEKAITAKFSGKTAAGNIVAARAAHAHILRKQLATT